MLLQIIKKPFLRKKSYLTPMQKVKNNNSNKIFV